MRPVRAVLGVVAVVGLVSACTSAPMPPPAASESATPSGEAGATALADYYGQSLEWRPCGQQVECATLTVPKDYEDPEAGDLQLAVARYRAKGSKQGSLVFNPGGPGGSGVEFAEAAPYVVSPEVLSAYDFVGFDPRGVGGSDPVDCLSDKQTDAVVATDPDPTTDAEIAQFEKDSRLIAKTCEQKSGDLLSFIDSGSVVRDMDILRAALGEERLDYMGKSYGTKLGALYAEQFPSRVGRMVLDGVLPPDLDAAQISEGQAIGFEDALRRYVEWCLDSADCPLEADSVDSGVAEIQGFLDKLESQPLPAGGRELTRGLGMQAILYYLYFPYAGDWVKLNRGLREAFAGNGATLVGMLDERLERDPSGSYKNNGNSYDAFIAISCVDDQGDVDVEELKARAGQWAKEAPTFGPALSWSEYVCNDWPVPAKPTAPKATAEGAGPILLVSTSHDPATPLTWAEQMASDLDDAHLIVLDADGHTAYFNGSSCIDQAVDDYLLSGAIPEDGLKCTDGRQP